MQVQELTLAELIGPMVGADLISAHGRIRDFNSERAGDATSLSHTFWVARDEWRCERSDGLTTVNRRIGSITRWGDRIVDQEPALAAGRAIFHQLLTPKHALVWGRPGEDWRLSERLESISEHGMVRVDLISTQGDDDVDAHVDVDYGSGRIRVLDTGAARLELLELSEEMPDDLDRVLDSSIARVGGGGRALQ